MHPQNPDGGWGAAQGRRSNTEATSLAVSALQSLRVKVRQDNLRRGIMVDERQNPDVAGV